MRQPTGAALIASGAFAVALWYWHAPGPYTATFESVAVYWLMHATAFGTALWLWIALLDAAGVPHAGTSIPEDLKAPSAEATAVRGAAEGLITQFGDEARRYLRTIARYNAEAWPGLAEVVNPTS